MTLGDAEGGNRLPFGDQEAISCDAERGVMMKAAPATPFKMTEADLLFELLVVALDAPAQLGQVDEAGKGNVLGECRKPIFDRLGITFGPFDHEPFAWAA